MNLHRYWLRYGGSSFHLFKLPVRLTEAENLLASILSKSDRTKELLAGQSAESIGQFVDALVENELCGYALTSVYALKLQNELGNIVVQYGSIESDLMSTLIRQSASEAIRFETFDRQFTEFIEMASSLSMPLIWLKGIVTSRTCYGEPSMRLSSDFDCFVDPSMLQSLYHLLEMFNYRVITGDTGFCNQLGVGPVDSPAHLCLAPEQDFVPSGVMGFSRKHWPILDLKINPLDRGMKMIELDRFRKDAISVAWNGKMFCAPDLIDQLLISLTHLAKDRFKGWKQLLDIKLLAEKINQEPQQWNEMVRRCRVEGIGTDCWGGLTLARERLELKCVDDVIEQLKPVDHGLIRRLTTFTVTPLFYWNTSMFPMLLLHALVAEDSQRKKTILFKSFFPRSDFLSNYYNGGRPLNLFSSVKSIVLHWLVVLLPGGLIRRSFGRYIWSYEQVEGFKALPSQ